MLEVELLLAGEVEETARGADDDVDALAERLDLRLVGPAAVDGEDADVTHLARGQQVVRDLRAQLAGGDDDERLRGVGQLLGLGAANLDVGGDGHALQEREAETERLAGAGLGLADDVRAGKGYGERHLLDREGETIPTASRASAVSGRIPSSRKVVRVLPLLCARCEASAGVVSGPCRDVGCLTDNPRGQAVLHGTTADALALEPLRVPLRTPYAACRTGEEGCRVGADRATDRASSFVRPGEYSAGALPPYLGITHMRWPIWSRRRRHTD